MPLDWKDTTSYSQGGSREPKCWSVRLFGGMRLSVIRNHRDYPGQWIMSVTQIEMQQALPDIPLDDIASAQAKAIIVLRDHLLHLVDTTRDDREVVQDVLKNLGEIDEAEAMAARLYTIYCRSVGGKAYDGKPLPPWSEFGKDTNKFAQSNAWRAVAREAIAAETGVKSAPLLPVKKPDDEPGELDFSGKPNPNVVAQFLTDLLRGMDMSPEIRQRVAEAGLDGTPEEIYRKLNAPGHRVRDGLILLGHALLTPKPRKGNQWFIPHPGTLNHVECTSFENAMQKWFEGFNVPYLMVDGQKEDFKVSIARVDAYLKRQSPVV